MAKLSDKLYLEASHAHYLRNIPKLLRSCDTAEVNRLIQIVERKDTEIEALKLHIKELEAKA
ncbi:hypothetical protein BLD48_06035 [Exiguobacterium sp. KRL4]|uniref:hypothetical protein n=1 Tax=Exiguobacterium sp. KRL4 TaxID=1914536 RepID=UPI0008F7EB66|nr:hypothetical protein [Exiguobacterium sp. KRL4]OIN67446.1 hypothetical protein BLD48_06035 [Exiguobacterium sp. KRL4]